MDGDEEAGGEVGGEDGKALGHERHVWPVDVVVLASGTALHIPRFYQL